MPVLKVKTNGEWVPVGGAASSQITEVDPTVPAWAKRAEKPTYTAEEIGADAVGTANTAITAHNTAADAHNDIRELINTLSTNVNTVLDSDDATLDQLSEIVTYIKSNYQLIEEVTNKKVNVVDIVNNLTTNVTNKPLSAAQGVALKALIDSISVPTKISDLENDSDFLTEAPVTSVNNKTGVVTLTASDVGALPSDTKIPEAYVHPTSHPASLITGLATVATTGSYSDLINAPSALPNPRALTVNGISYDGSAAVSITTPAGLPAVTANNNGAFLRVVDGSWAVSTIPNAEEASF